MADLSSPDWLGMLVHAVATHPRGRAGVADDLGLSRSAISQVLAGVYPARTDKIGRRVVAQYNRVDCPHLLVSLTEAQCHAYALRPCPTASPREVRHWRACQRCPHRPTKGEPKCD